MQQRTNALRRRIEQWIQIQTLHMPVVARLRTDASPSPDAPEEAVHSIKLWMPSAVVSLGMVCTTTLYDIEWKLRSAQAHDALQELRQHLRLKRHLTGFKKDWIRGQHAIRGHVQ
jgi:hypothetical protein